jgi:hypothetical protein
MAFLQKSDIKSLRTESVKEARIWRVDYPSFERLADNGLMENLDPSLPEVNDGSLSASLFKLPKRIVSSKLSGTVKAIDKDEPWVSELANLVWQKDIIPFANTQAPFHRKWKDAVRKAAIYGSVPLITMFVESNGKRHADFIVGQPQDVTLEPGKVSDYDSSVKFWDIYYSKVQLESLIEQAKEETKPSEDKEKTGDEVNKWDIPALEEILKTEENSERSSQDTPRQEQNKDVKPKGYHFTIVVQDGVNAPFYMLHNKTNKTVREWSNPDPTGDGCIHFLYCYQDFINPYGIGIVKLAGGTQNVLDYMRQADVLATQLGLRPPIAIEGDADSADLDSLVYAQDALWFTGNATVKRQELANGVYNQLPSRIQMYKQSLNQILPTGETSATSAETGDTQNSKTPAGVKFQAANLSIDDEDFKDNLYMTYEAVAKSMINTHFANMEGTDLMKLSDDEREILKKAGMEFPETPDGKVSNEVELVWDTMRASFDFEVDPELDKTKDDATKLEGLTRVAELIASDPTLEQDLAIANKKLNKGELYSEIISLTSDNDKIITDVGPEDGQGGIDPQTGQPLPPQMPPTAQSQPDPMMQANLAAKEQQMKQSQELHNAKLQKMSTPSPSQNQGPQTSPQVSQSGQPQPTPQEIQANVQAVMKQHGVSEATALAMLAAEHQGLNPKDIIDHVNQLKAKGQA